MKKLKMILTAVVLLAVANVVSADTFGTGINQFTIDFVKISGDASSANGTNIGAGMTFSNPTNDYRMGTYEVTNDQWSKFADITGTPTGSPSNAYDESPDRFTGKDVPTNEVSFYEAAQFVNYLNMSTGHQAAYKFSGTQGTSSYTLESWSPGDAGYDASNPFRNSNAHYFLPTEDEWVKAAYWNGTSLQDYATTDNSLPKAGVKSNYQNAIRPGMPWDVGSGSEELNSTFDMMGNVSEWMENPFSSGNYQGGSARVLRGGSYSNPGDYLGSLSRFGMAPLAEGYSLGFRVASAASEPCSLILLSVGGLVLLSIGAFALRRKRKA